jgi:type III pantothenate kinase
MTMLAIDAGNTRVKWAWHDGSQWRTRGWSATATVRDQERIEIESVGAIERVMACNVAGPVVMRAIEREAARLGARCDVVVPSAGACGVVNGYSNPHQLGTDRWAALLGAHASDPDRTDKLIALVGTALTLDALGADGRHWGGLIVPGANLMRHALAERTAGLREGARKSEQSVRSIHWPRDTASAIAQGIDTALIGAVLQCRNRMIEQSGRTPLVVLAGGGAVALASALPFETTIDDNLIFNGLLALASQP